MREHPIIMSGDSVRAVLAGTKSQTRRVVKRASWMTREPAWDEARPTAAGTLSVPYPEARDTPHSLFCPYGHPGDRLWVREAWWRRGGHSLNENGEAGSIVSPIKPYVTVAYRADNSAPPRPASMDDGWVLRSPIHMPREASRLTLEIVGVRAERLWAIADHPADVRAEGYRRCLYRGEVTARVDDPDDFTDAWDHLNLRRGYGWQTNCWVWVITFTRVEAGDQNGRSG